MINNEFILQGFTTKTHGDVVRELFNIPDIQNVLISVAFVSDDGVKQIEKQLQSYTGQITILVGVRNDITSYQALKRLHEIIGDSLYIVDTGARHIVFHPKLYLARSDVHARLIIGSANLTLGGLNNNIEASMRLDFDLTSGSDKNTVAEIESNMLSLSIIHPNNIFRVKAVSELDELLLSGRLIDETVALPPHSVATTNLIGRNDAIPRIILMASPLRRVSRRARASKVVGIPPATVAKAVSTSLTTTPAILGSRLELVWKSKLLTRRDLTIPDTGGTNATGSINLDKGLLSEEVDHRHYFRDVVFSSLAWTSGGPTVEVAFAKFQLILKNINYGEFKLRIAHTTSTTTKAYLQRNAMTRLSWGVTRQYIAQADLISRTLDLYRDQADPTRFVLEID